MPARREIPIQQVLADLIATRTHEGHPAFWDEIGRAFAVLAGAAEGRDFAFSPPRPGEVGLITWGEGPVVAVLGHLDVVPAPEEGWLHDPFSGAVADGCVWGRGALDDKGPIVSSLYALLRLAATCPRPRRSVHLVLGCDEESGDWADVRAYGLRTAVEAGFTPDGAFPVVNGEKGFLNVAVRFRGAPGTGILSLESAGPVNMVPPRAEALLDQEPAPAACPEGLSMEVAACGGRWRLVARGRSSHGSRPEQGRNALQALLCRLAALADRGATGRAASWTRRFLAMETDGALLGLAHRHPRMGALTVNLGRVECRPEVTTLELNVRNPRGIDADRVLEEVRRRLAGLDAEAQVMTCKEPLWMDEDAPLVQKLRQAYRTASGLEPDCLSIGGTTYAKALPGILAYGPSMPGEERLEHCVNERVSVEALERNARIYEEALRLLVAGP